MVEMCLCCAPTLPTQPWQCCCRNSATPRPAPPPPPPVVGETMRALLVDMKKAHPGQDEAVKTCWQTLLKVWRTLGGGRELVVVVEGVGVGCRQAAAAAMPAEMAA